MRRYGYKGDFKNSFGMELFLTCVKLSASDSHNFEAVALYTMPPAMISLFFGTIKSYKTTRVKVKDYG